MAAKKHHQLGMHVASPAKTLRRADCCAIDTCTAEAVKVFNAFTWRK